MRRKRHSIQISQSFCAWFAVAVTRSLALFCSWSSYLLKDIRNGHDLELDLYTKRDTQPTGSEVLGMDWVFIKPSSMQLTAPDSRERVWFVLFRFAMFGSELSPWYLAIAC